MRFARAACAALLSLSAISLVASAAHGDVTGLGFSPTSPAPGSTITVSGAGCAADEAVLILTWIPSGGAADETTSLGTANGSGSFSIPVTLTTNPTAASGVQFGVAAFCGGERNFDDPDRHGTTFGRFGGASVEPENRPPVGVADSFTVVAGGTLTVPGPGVLANDSDPDGDVISASLFVGPTNGVASLTANGSLTYTPNAGFTGTDVIIYRVFDGRRESNNTTITIVVTDAPDDGESGGGDSGGGEISDGDGPDRDEDVRESDRDGVLPSVGGMSAGLMVVAAAFFIAGSALVLRRRQVTS